MNIGCILFGAWLFQCPPEPPPEARQLAVAVMLRPVIEESVSIANRMLAAADEPYRITPFWSLDGRALGEDEIVVYLRQSPASPAARAVQRKTTTAVVAAMQSDQSGIDDALYDCGDLDDCVARLYPEETINLAVRALNKLTRWEVGRTRPECRCIVLIEHDLQMFDIVFGADWDRYILLTRYAGFPGELEAAIEDDRLPEALTDGETVTLASMVTLILLHEVGHSASHPIRVSDATAAAGLDGWLESLDEDRREELRADAYVGRVLGRACFGRRLETVEAKACLAPDVLSMLTFVIGMKGKSHEARCLRYLDTVKGYPNWQARFMVISLLLDERPSAIGLLKDYLKTRTELAQLPWVSEVPACNGASAE